MRTITLKDDVWVQYRIDLPITLKLIWQAPRQQRRRYACQISERYNHHNTQFRGLETSLDFAARRLSALWIEAMDAMF